MLTRFFFRLTFSSNYRSLSLQLYYSGNAQMCPLGTLSVYSNYMPVSVAFTCLCCNILATDGSTAYYIKLRISLVKTYIYCQKEQTIIMLFLSCLQTDFWEKLLLHSMMRHCFILRTIHTDMKGNCLTFTSLINRRISSSLTFCFFFSQKVLGICQATFTVSGCVHCLLTLTYTSNAINTSFLRWENKTMDHMNMSFMQVKGAIFKG